MYTARHVNSNCSLFAADQDVCARRLRIQSPVEIQTGGPDWMAVCCSLLPPRPDVPSRHTGSLNKVTRGDFPVMSTTGDVSEPHL